MKEKAVVVVPIYMKKINYFEQISLKQVFAVLGDEFPIVAVAPSGLCAEYMNCFDRIVFYDEHYFNGLSEYSELMTSIDFYKDFEAYEYMLVYQLDAFVFSNRLMEFCKKGYSYIGAVVGNKLWGYLDNHVGNGGFSLRKIDSCINILRNKNRYLERIKNKFTYDISKKIVENEDQFWAFCGQIEGNGFTVPSNEEASLFSLEANINNSFDWLNDKLPFGCHRWYKANFEIWGPIISDLGYVFPENEVLKWTQYGTEYIREQFFEMYSGKIPDEMKQNLYIGNQSIFSIWGAGTCGEHCCSILEECGYQIDKIFDKKILHNIWNSGRDTIYSEEWEIKKSLPIIISSYLYKNEMIEELLNWGLKKDIDFFCWTEIETKWLAANGMNVELI